MSGKLLVIGFGPGSFEHITQRAKEAIEESDVIIGYKTYVDLISGLLTKQEIVSTGMTEEVSRAQEAVRQAEAGKKVAVISSGDAGVYGMAGLIYEVLVEKGWKEETGVLVEIIPGISAINSCASLLGAPVMHDACTISLSDHLTPWDLIAKRVEAAASTDFVIALYNPKSGRRTRQIAEAQRILLQYRSPETPVGLVKSAYREREQVIITNLQEMLNYDIGMLTTVIIGNSSTFLYDNKIITPRGYQRKYTLNKEEQDLKLHQRLQKEAEPWALHQGQEEKEEQEETLLQWAQKAVQTLDKSKGETNEIIPSPVVQRVYAQESIFEFAVSPGVANKNFSSQQMLVLASVVGEEGKMEYTPHHQLIIRIPTSEPEKIQEELSKVGLILSPIGDVVQVKACDFCDGEKVDSIPYAEELHRRLSGLAVPKEVKIGFNGCGMACYGAVREDIGIVFRKGAFDLFLGAKTVGRNAHSGQIVAEGIAPEEVADIVERIVHQFTEQGHPNERFHKFFKRVKEVQGYAFRDVTPDLQIEPAACGE